MFRRPITIKVEVDATEDLACINKNTIVPLLRKRCSHESLGASGSEAIAKTSRATREDAESYDHLCYAENLIGLASVVEGRPLMKGFELAGAGFQKAFAKAA